MNERDVQDALYALHSKSALAVLPNFQPLRWHECDLFVWLRSGYTLEYEIKLTRSDYLAELRNKIYKHRQLAGDFVPAFLPSRYSFVVSEGLVSVDEVPSYAGLLYALEGGGLRKVKTAPRIGKKLPWESRWARQCMANLQYKLWRMRLKGRSDVDEI